MSRHDMFKLAEEIDFSQRSINEMPDFVARGRQAQATVDAMTWPLQIVISGFQTGADQGGSRAGKACGYRTGGMMPKKFLTEDGPRPDLAADYGARESQHASYTPRTRWNLMNSDGTLIFYPAGRELDGGSANTQLLCENHKRPCLPVMYIAGTTVTCSPSIEQIRTWIIEHRIRTLNI